MISRLSKCISEYLCKMNVIPLEDRELYAYGFFLLLSRGIFLVTTALIGAILGIFWESVLFYTIFSLLREYAGGVHASKETVCLICTILMMSLGVISIRLFENEKCIGIALVLLLVGSVIVYFLSPLDSENKPLTSSERQYYGKKTRRIVEILVLSALILMPVKNSVLLYIIAVTLILEGALLILAKII